ncbi:ATP-grasp domain-containing protein [Janthinobacterium sp. GW460P]|uniref:ATP-grasp domain-containing protein n=1 Tax=unclassified Janthinobacterium TaxID=2610881 RepID=UPI000A32474B|nr:MULTISPECIES: ATP-grasp domain-containing protein [unclassified Janthinobacterium]MCC7701845.1 ATP-grasp domain-containing protein [Janthinobacterium sp. GW460P]MCC7707353.1 ATP-grasp domain-containing protein [Janthinobacterium sp. GW460W]
MQKKDINILFLGGAKRVSLAEKFIDEGKERGLNVNIFSYELDINVPISLVGEIVIGLRWSDKNLYDHLLETIKTKKINIVLPFLDYATIVSARLKKLVEDKDVFMPVSDEGICEVFFNKRLANEWCIENSINIPSDTNNYPLIAKPIHGSASKGILILESPADFDNLTNKENYLVQKFVKGKEYSVDVYVSVQDKEIVSIVPRIRLETQGGESIKSITLKDERLINFSREIIEKTKLVGPLTLQLIEDSATKELYFMEINPRFGGAVLNSIFAGANSPKYLLNDFYKIKNSYDGNWIDSFLMMRRFSENYKICK